MINLIDKYENALNHNDKNNIKEINKIEKQIQKISNDILIRKQERFIKTAHHYNDNNLEKQLFNHFDSNYDK